MQAIRRFRSSDLQRILEIERDAFPKSPYDAHTFITYWKTYPDSFLVYEDGEVKGYIIFEPDGHIISIAVDVRHRRKGIGTMLVNEVLRVAGKAYVEVRASNSAAIEFYRKLGFREHGRIPLYYGSEDALVMVKNSPLGL